MHDAMCVGELQASADLSADLQGSFQRWPMFRSVLNQALDISAAHQFGDDVGLAARLFAQIEHGNNVWLSAQTAHRLGLPLDAVAADLVQAVGLDQSEGDVAIEQRVVGKVDALLATLAQEAFDGIAAI